LTEVPRAIVVSNDQQASRWLQYQLEAAQSDCQVQIETTDSLDQ
jgi:hypothetical protein